MELTAFDKQLLNILQGGVQFVPKPYEAMAEQLGVSEDRVISRLQELKKDGRSASVVNVSVTDDTGRDIAQYVGTGFKL